MVKIPQFDCTDGPECHVGGFLPQDEVQVLVSPWTDGLRMGKLKDATSIEIAFGAQVNRSFRDREFPFYCMFCVSGFLECCIEIENNLSAFVYAENF